MKTDKYRKSRGKTEEEIIAEEGFNHFMDILDGTKERRNFKLEDRKSEEVEEEQEGIPVSYKDSKTTEKHEKHVNNGICRVMPCKIVEAITKLINKVWKEDRLPTVCKSGVIYLINT